MPKEGFALRFRVGLARPIVPDRFLQAHAIYLKPPYIKGLIKI